MKIIPYGKHFIDNQDIKAVTKVLKTPQITQGKLVKKFEDKICKITGAKYAIAVSSCTAGLHISLQSLGFKQNDYLLTSVITFVSSPNSALFLKGKVGFVDIENNDSVSMCLKDLENKIKKYKPKVVMPVHMGGTSYNFKVIKRLSKKYKFKIIEDAAHSFGASYDNKYKIGSCKYSDITVFSFHPVKTVTTGEGGVITTNNFKLYLKCLRLRSHGINKLNDKAINIKNAFTNNKLNQWYYEMRELGYHYRITDIQCALGISQLEKLKKILSYKKEVFKRYDKAFKNIENISILQKEKRNNTSYHLYLVKFNFKKMNKDRQSLLEFLEKNNIITQVHYIPVVYHPYYEKKFNKEKFPNAINYYEGCLSLPCYFNYSKKDQNFVIKKIIEFIS